MTEQSYGMAGTCPTCGAGQKPTGRRMALAEHDFGGTVSEFDRVQYRCENGHEEWHTEPQPGK